MTNEEVKEKFEESIEEGNRFYGAQSSKVSQNIRTLVMGIIAIIWVVSYNNGIFKLPNLLLIISLFISFGYLVIDILHYFLDTRFYYNKLISLEKNYGQKMYLTTYNQALIKYSKVSYGWIWAKVIVFAIIAILFVVGMWNHLL
ncbi:MAG: hypothetical protein IJP52_02570 [Paludibacteraceae bacterium]|nr:hypothetical protein [Paludibacteraceae bacterium]